MMKQKIWRLVRPMAMEKTIIECIEVAKEKGNCVVCVPATETVIVKRPDGALDIPDRDTSLMARAPQCFVLKDILEAHRKALAEGIRRILCCYLSHRSHSCIGSRKKNYTFFAS